MTSAALEIRVPAVRSVSFARQRLTMDLEDGRTVTVPLEWFPRLHEGTPKERKNWELLGAGYGVHWPDLDEDISVEDLLLGRRSKESQKSLHAWRAARAARHKNS